ERHGRNHVAADAEEATEPGKRRIDVSEVLQHLGAQCNVERLVRDGYPLDAGGDIHRPLRILNDGESDIARAAALDERPERLLATADIDDESATLADHGRYRASDPRLHARHDPAVAPLRRIVGGAMVKCGKPGFAHAAPSMWPRTARPQGRLQWT